MMKRLKINDLRLKIFLFIIFLLFINHQSLFINHILAADSTPSADPLRQSDSEESIKSKLEELKKQIASRAAALKLEVNKKLKDKAYIGKVKHKSETSLTIETDQGSKSAAINQDTLFESKVKGKKYSQKLILEEDYIASLGDIDEKDTLTARKVVLLPTQNLEPKTFLWGQIIEKSSKQITLKNKDLKNITVILNNPTAVKVSDFVILTGSKGKNDVFNAEFVYITAQSESLKSKVASPSAKIASPSATSKASKPSPKPASR